MMRSISVEIASKLLRWLLSENHNREVEVRDVTQVAHEAPHVAVMMDDGMACRWMSRRILLEEPALHEARASGREHLRSKLPFEELVAKQRLLVPMKIFYR